MRLFGLQGSSNSSATFAARGSVGTIGDEKWLTDASFANGRALFWWNGTYWRLASPTHWQFDLTPVNGIVSAAEQILKQPLMPAGLMRSCSSIKAQCLFGKDATSESALCRLRIGSAGTTADQSLLATNITTTTRTLPLQWYFATVSATSIRQVGSQGTNLDWNAAANAATVTSFTIPDIDTTPLYFSFSVTPTAAVPTVHHVIIELFP